MSYTLIVELFFQRRNIDCIMFFDFIDLVTPNDLSCYFSVISSVDNPHVDSEKHEPNIMFYNTIDKRMQGEECLDCMAQIIIKVDRR